MRKSLSKMNTNELRDLAVELGADRKKLYGTSKQSLILTIDRLRKEAASKENYIIVDENDNVMFGGDSTTQKLELIKSGTCTTASTRMKTARDTSISRKLRNRRKQT